jgi:hypothetical protein
MRAQPRAAMVFGATKYWHGWTGKPEDIARDYIWHFDFEANVLVRSPFLLLVAPLSHRYTPSMSNILLRRNSVETIGGFANAFIGVREDMVSFTKLFYKTFVYHADACWDRYRQHPGNSQARQARKRQREQRRELLRDPSDLQWQYFPGRSPHPMGNIGVVYS